MINTRNYEPSKTAIYLSELQTTLFYNLGGPILMPICYQVNFFKGLTFVWVISLMLYFNNKSTAMILYLVLHGSYGICWVIKDFVFPDFRAQKMGTVCSHALLFTLLIFYWMIPVPLAAGLGDQDPSIVKIGIYSTIYLAGLILMMGSDYQKYHTLKVRKGLISSGFFKYTRNPNYLGEIFIYLSFCLCSGNCLSFFFFVVPAGILFTLNIYLKEQMSFKLKKGYEEYANQSNFLFFRICKNQVIDWIIYTFGIGVALYVFWQNKSADFFYLFNQTIDDL